MKEVKPPKKSLIFYYGVALIVLLAFNLFLMPLIAQSNVNDVDYGTFMAMTENGEIGRVEVESNQIIFTDKDIDSIVEMYIQSWGSFIKSYSILYSILSKIPKF